MCILKKVSVGLKCVCESRILRVEERGPLNNSLSRKTVNLIVGSNGFAKLTKIETSSISEAS